jgi:DNA replication protein DnaC
VSNQSNNVGYDALCLDELGYTQQSNEEGDILFQLLAERYEQKTVVITSNLVFSQWDKIFHNPMTALAAADRLVHHGVVLEFSNESLRTPTGPRLAPKAHLTAAARGGRAPPPRRPLPRII